MKNSTLIAVFATVGLLGCAAPQPYVRPALQPSQQPEHYPLSVIFCLSTYQEFVQRSKVITLTGRQCLANPESDRGRAACIVAGETMNYIVNSHLNDRARACALARYGAGDMEQEMTETLKASIPVIDRLNKLWGGH